MFDEIEIGSISKKNAIITVAVYGTDGNVLESIYDYYICNSILFLGIDMVISKDTEEGRRLKELIDIGDIDITKSFLERTLCKNCPAGQLIKAIKKSQNIHLEEGKKEAKREIRQALGL